ncbi:MAG: flagellar hook protein FlgE [Candidatus Kapabacteria bacterium]|nr:flagellar hook protein FlgE [Candidatus Kapabacteria bacterium]
MSLSRTLSSGASSLIAQQLQMDVISNNIANASTTGYKSMRGEFADQLSQIYNYGSAPTANLSGSGFGGTDPKEIGLGVKLVATTNNFSQGAMETTSRPLDLALQGDGFFVYNVNGTSMYSRDGAISIDKSGNLVNSQGALLQGYNVLMNNGLAVKGAYNTNMLTGGVHNLNIPPNVISAPTQTTNVTVQGNLDTNMVAGATNDRKTSIDIFDTAGGKHTLYLHFSKPAGPPAPAAGQYSMNIYLDNDSVAAKSVGITVSPAAAAISVPVNFNPDGTLIIPAGGYQLDSASLNNANSLAAPRFSSAITLKLSDPSNLMAGMTNLAQTSNATAIASDGYTSGDLKSLSVDPNGRIIGAFTNGQSELLGQVSIAKFSNQGGLVKQGNNMFITGPDSGNPNVSTAGDIFSSTLIVSNSLESSNVDITTEFVNMIKTQRAFEAASRTITTADQLLQEVNQLKR